MNKLFKSLICILYIICSIGMILGVVYVFVQTGNAYRIIYLELGIKNLIISFMIGLGFYIAIFYGIYRLDLKVRGKINKNNTK